ncbi:MAG: transcriptional repressor LexA [Clostridia bacterium]|nr:transcriptional repressor LexA [Clostridia bacterium]
MGKIEEKLNKVHQYIKRYQAENGFPPSVREICSALSISSTATCQYYLNKLKDRGILNKNANKNRAISVCDKAEFVSVPLIGTVTAGTPILAVENLEGYFPLPPEFAREDETFMLTVRGDSMIEAGIFNGDKIICKKTSYADNGDIVVALVEDSATVKRFYKRHGKFILHPENSQLCDIVLNEVEILGKVTGLIRKF